MTEAITYRIRFESITGYRFHPTVYYTSRSAVRWYLHFLKVTDTSKLVVTLWMICGDEKKDITGVVYNAITELVEEARS